ncbi:MAG: NEW3 domain-containing protein, partial [Lysobacter sp.]
RSAPTIGLSGPTGSLTAGTKANYTLSVRNNDSATCTSTSFQLAKSAPSGWSSTLTSTLSVAPGMTGTTAMTVTSATTAKEGKYSIAAGISSSVGSTHTASGSASYTVASSTAPTPPPATGALEHTVALNKSVYSRGETVIMTARVMKGTAPVRGARVIFNVTRPNGQVVKVAAYTATDGYAKGKMIVGRASTDLGSYVLRSDATAALETVSAYASFTAR